MITSENNDIRFTVIYSILHPPFYKKNLRTDQGIPSYGKVSFEILPEKRHITKVLDVLLFMEDFQMEPLELFRFKICLDLHRSFWSMILG